MDVGGDTSHPIKNALVPSKHVLEGCGGKYQKSFLKKLAKKRAPILALLMKRTKKFLHTNFCTFFFLPFLSLLFVLLNSVATIQYEDYQDSSSNPQKDCSSKICYNHGICVEQWLNPVCNCDLTTFTGPSCADGNNKVYPMHVNLKSLCTN